MEKANRLKKAWHVWHKGMIGLGPEIYNSVEDTPIYYADTPGEAKNKSSEVYDFEIDGEPHKFTDIKARRAPGADVYLFEGKQQPLWRIKLIKEGRELISSMKAKVNEYPDTATFYVQNNFVGNAMLLWQKGGGYTCDLSKAQEFTKDEILNSFIPGRREDRIFLASHLKEIAISTVDGQHLNYKFKI